VEGHIIKGKGGKERGREGEGRKEKEKGRRREDRVHLAGQKALKMRT